MRATYREATETPTAALPMVPIRHRRSRVRVDDRVRWRSVVRVEVSAPRVLIHLASLNSVLPQLAYATAILLITLVLLSLPRLTDEDA